ncbi:MAG: hypothetical protein J7L45_02810 [Candidatus Aenigmarchaeota archaeon]|nr:hypothetical protein [Candidatus Aenigmarchaeota archaeon]
MFDYFNKFVFGPMNWLKHFEKTSMYLGSNEKEFIRKYVKRRKVDRFFPIFQKIGEDIAGIEAEKITKSLIVDFVAAVKIIDDYIDQKEDDIQVIYDLFEEGREIHPRLKTLKKWLKSIQETIEDKYEIFERSIPKGIEAVRCEMSVEDLESALVATKKSGELGMDFIADLMEVYSDESVDKNVRNGLRSIGFMANLLDDVADMKEDYGIRKTSPILLYESYREDHPKQKAKKLAVKETRRIAEKIYKSGMKNIERKDRYRLLGNLIKLKYGMIAKKKLKEF